MIVSRRNDTVLSHWSRSVALCLRWLCIFLMILKSLNLFVSSMTTVLNLRSTEMVMLLKDSFLKVSIITGLLFLHLTRPVNSPISQIPFGTRNSFSMFSTMILMCQLCLWPLVSLSEYSGVIEPYWSLLRATLSVFRSHLFRYESHFDNKIKQSKTPSISCNINL